MAGAAPGPRTALLIPVPADTIFIYPSNGVLAVVAATINGSGTKASARITTPEPIAKSFTNSVPLFTNGHRELPNWLQVREDYAGEAREISDADYAGIWRAWWFRQGGLDFEPDRVVTLRTDAQVSMLAVWEMFLRLRELTLSPNDEGALETVARAVNGVPYKPADLANLRNVSPRLAGLVLRCDDSFNQDMAGLVAALLAFDRDELVASRAKLTAPWHQRRT